MVMKKLLYLLILFPFLAKAQKPILLPYRTSNVAAQVKDSANVAGFQGIPAYYGTSLHGYTDFPGQGFHIDPHTGSLITSKGNGTSWFYQDSVHLASLLNDTTSSLYRTKLNSLTLAQLQIKFNGYIPTTRNILNGYGILGGTNLAVDITKSVDTSVIATKTFIGKYELQLNKTATISNSTTTYPNWYGVTHYGPTKQHVDSLISGVLSGRKFKNVVIVDKTLSKLADYTTINAALAAAGDSINKPKTILIMPGVYEENVNITGTRYISLIGIDKDNTIILDRTGNYYTPPLEVSGHVYCANLTFKSTSELAITPPALLSYAIHMDFYGSGLTEFYNCKMISMQNAAIGIGLHQDQTLIIDNCFLSRYGSYNGGSLYMHNSPNPESNQKMIVKESRIEADSGYAVRIDDARQDAGGVDINTTVSFYNNSFWSRTYGGDTCYHFYPSVSGGLSGRINITRDSYGNSLHPLNILYPLPYSITEPVGNYTVVLRDGSGHINANYFNTTAALESFTPTSFYVNNGTDNYIRRVGSTQIKTALGLGSNAYTSTSYLPLTGGTVSGLANFQSESGTEVIHIGQITTTNPKQILITNSPSTNSFNIEAVQQGISATNQIINIQKDGGPTVFGGTITANYSTGVMHSSSSGVFSSSPIVQGDVTNGFVDLSTTQASIAGDKTFTGIGKFNAGLSINSVATFLQQPSTSTLSQDLLTNITSTGDINRISMTGTSGMVLGSDGSKPLFKFAAGAVMNNWDVTGSNAAQTLLTHAVGAADATFIISANLKVTAISVDVIQTQVVFTDPDGTVQTQLFYGMGATSAGLSAMGRSNYSVMGEVRAKAGTNIVASTVLAVGGGTITYNSSGTIFLSRY
jgi:hypothetical protein